MQKFIIAGFVVVMGLMAAGADFFTQWRAADGPYGPREYMASFAERAEAETREAAREELLARPIKSFLPDAPEGWVRSEWSPAAEEEIDGKREISAAEQELLDAIRSSAQGKMILAADAMGKGHKETARSYVYRKGDNVVILAARLQKDEPLRVSTSAAADMIRSTLARPGSATGFAHAQGVSWARKGGALSALRGGNTKTEAGIKRTFQTRMGDRVRLQIKARADDAAIREIMHAVDYVALNTLNDAPMRGVRADLPPMTVKQQVFVAQRWADQRHQQRLQQRAKALAKYDSGDHTPTFLEQMVTPGVAEYRLKQQQAETQDTAPDTRKADVKVENPVPVQASAEPAKKSGALALLSIFGGGAEKAAAEERAKAEAEARAAEQALLEANARIAQLGLVLGDLRIAQDGRSGKPQAEWKAANGGGLKKHHPRFELRSHEVARGLAPGSCLQLTSKQIHCDANADAIRLAAQNRPADIAPGQAQATDPQDMSVQEERAAVKVNRFSTRGKSSSCGRGTFCRVGN